MTDILVTSFGVEAIRETNTRVRVTGLAAEVIRKDRGPDILATGAAVEVLRTGVRLPRTQIIVATGD